MNRLERVKQLRQKRIPKPLPIPEKGERGEKGDIGLPGINGKDGRDGKDGLPGARGKQGLPGKRGEKGEPGRDGIDGKGVVWRADWSNGTKYSVNDAVSCFGSAFICIKDHKANNKSKPSVGENWHAYWAVMAERGEQGPGGANGQQGADGEPGPNTVTTTTTTDLTGILKGNGANVGTATAGTDYVAPNNAIAGATKTKITYDAKGLVTGGEDATTSDISEGSNLYFTNERVDDRVDALIQDSATTAPGITFSYDDSANTLTPTVKQSYDTFIYNSSGGQSGNRFNTWSDLITAITKQEGAKTIYFEQDETIPAGSYNLDYVTLRGNGNEYNAGGYTITFGDNTTISSWKTLSVHSLLLKSTSTTGHICTFSTVFLLQCETVSNIQSSSSYEFFASSYAGQNIIALRNSARWSLIAGKPLMKFTGGAFTQQIILSRGDGAVVNHNTLSSTNAQILVDIIGSVNGNNASYPITNTGLTVGFFLPLTLTNVSAAAFI